LDMPKNLPGHELKCTASYTWTGGVWEVT
jgi:hypothetical protein